MKFKLHVRSRTNPSVKMGVEYLLGLWRSVLKSGKYLWLHLRLHILRREPLLQTGGMGFERCGSFYHPKTVWWQSAPRCLVGIVGFRCLTLHWLSMYWFKLWELLGTIRGVSSHASGSGVCTLAQQHLELNANISMLLLTAWAPPGPAWLGTVTASLTFPHPSITCYQNSQR